jgi:diguanylate cyclase (GGDEF)-like protein
MKKSAKSPEVFLLAAAEELGQPYTDALKKSGLKSRWFSCGKSLLSAVTALQAPVAVVVDCDSLGEALGELAADLRAAYPSCELIALSSVDSSKMAMECLRSGFSDFLLKPLSPEQLTWSIQHGCRRRELNQQWTDPKTRLLRTMTSLSSSGSPLLVRVETLRHLRALFGARSAGWFSSTRKREVFAAIPSGKTSSAPANLEPGVFRAKASGRRRVVLSARSGERLALGGIAARVPASSLREARLVLDYAEVALSNLEKFDRIKQQTFVDDLTGLYNSRYLKFSLAQAVALSRRNSHPFSVLFIDLDRFKSINDRFGHTVGSDLLIAIARTLKNSLRSRDPIFRYGGDEFVVILNGTALGKAYEIAERLRAHIERKTFVIRGHEVGVTISVGLAVYPDHASEHQTLLRLADEAMYAAKKQTRNAVHLAHDGSPVKVPEAGT